MSRKASYINGFCDGGGGMPRGRKGFTLVELLVVIIIIGILAGAAMLASGGGTASARAAVIVSNLRTIKSAALEHFADKGTWPKNLDNLTPYLDDMERFQVTDEYENTYYTYELADEYGNLFASLGNGGIMPVAARFCENCGCGGMEGKCTRCNTEPTWCECTSSPQPDKIFAAYAAFGESEAVCEKLAAQAEKIGLFGIGDDGTFDHRYNANDFAVAMRIK